MSEKPAPQITEENKAFYEAAAGGKLAVQKCKKCSEHFFYPRAWCPHCWSLDFEWREVSGRGRIATFTVVHQPPSKAFEVPYVLAVVALEEGPQMMTNIIGAAADKIAIDMPVEVTFEKRGEITIPQFELAKK